ncbi:uncharacterized aarF domain-containing protein kinase 5 isoform X2 [Anoplophora glabripennis]|nr:uncharacterized aarF domain-containing protein kinase 5 isoform X2 [Anoplophora glabripennis]XP_018567139.1 uncharacterized aarF domain-containing protein kinase 5 isoform X2 [Anoplophora glabripennis]XP_018567141.1 uncharacterized aarF domain-containing protein kinase 5 isoform X2 [Anoplophora glabripennis]XP_018567142.1 uncharacterized aarF domain-containing protein kinase 5 isoform X2 [Anoplophora glabripennis]
MSKSRTFNYLWKYLLSYNNNVQKFVKYTGIGVGCATATALPAVVTNCKEDSGNIVANVYGGIRFLRSLKIGLWISVDYYFSMMGLNESQPNYNAMMSRIHRRAANNILYGCLCNGGSYIKLGQGLVSMSHILPKQYIETLKALQDKCLARDDDEIKKLFLEDFGKDPSEIFKSFESKPIAAASIAQVYKATTKNDECVAVKVQYIDLQKRFKNDVQIINFLLKIAAFIHPNFNFTWVLADLEKALKQELDFIKEGQNSERCAKDLQHLKYIYIPKVFWEYTSTRVLVTEFVEGYKINEVEKLKKNGFSLADLNNKLFEAFGHQIFQTGFVHADPHPGNVLVRRVNGKAQLILLDHGLYQTISDKDRIALGYMWKAIVLNDLVNMKKYANELGVENYELFAEILTQSPLKSYGFRLKVKLSEEDLKYMTEFARKRFDSIICCLQTMPCTLLLVIRNLNTIRAIAHDHGNPIDRYTVLARAATKRVYGQGDCQYILTRVLNFPLWIYFEAILNINRIRRWAREVTLQVLGYFGMVPDVRMILKTGNIS